MIFFANNIDLSEKLNYYKKNKNERVTIAKKGQKKYFHLFNERNVAKYIVEKSIGFNSKYKAPWE